LSAGGEGRDADGVGDETDIAELTLRNEHFIEACRRGSWEMLQPILAADFRYLDGVTGELWEMPRYIRDLRAHPSPALSIDEIAIHVAGDTATVSARTRTRSHPGRQNRYLDTYTRRDGGWVCVHACVWRLPDGLG